jgi:23S rRNA-/tRNA-specific pseudouridylate synthase
VPSKNIQLQPPPLSSDARLARIEQTLRTRYHCWKLYNPVEGESTLLELLRRRLPHIEPQSWAERFDFGGVYVNGHEALADCALPFPSKIEYYEPKFKISEASTVFTPLSEQQIVFHDEHVAVVYKPPHLPSMPAKEQRHYSLKRYLEQHFNTAIHMPSRLDVSAQGLLIVSLSPAAHAGLQHSFERRTAHKAYSFATSRCAPFEQLTIERAIKQDPLHAVLRMTSLTEGQAAATVLTFSHDSVSENLAVSVINAQPITGRTHQIRVHAASHGLPIVGDNFYDGTPAHYLHLVSRSLEITHPVSRKLLSISAPVELLPAWVTAQ